jgi:hypothetical protein
MRADEHQLDTPVGEHVSHGRRGGRLGGERPKRVCVPVPHASPARAVYQSMAGDRQQPGARVLRHAVVRPRRESSEQRLAQRVLGFRGHATAWTRGADPAAGPRMTHLTSPCAPHDAGARHQVVGVGAQARLGEGAAVRCHVAAPCSVERAWPHGSQPSRSVAAKSGLEITPATRRQRHDAAVKVTDDPLPSQSCRQQGRAQRAPEMVPSLAPVQTGGRESPAGCASGLHVHSHASEPGDTGGRDSYARSPAGRSQFSAFSRSCSRTPSAPAMWS